MKTIGLIGGMSWESTVPYYRLLNQGVQQRLGGHHSARCLLYSVDFDDIERMQRDGNWEAAGELLASAAATLERAGAELLLLCTNTMHKVASAIESRVRVPLLHIVDPTADAIRAAGLDTVGLLGTRFTMEEGFYRDRLQLMHGIRTLVPEPVEREDVHRIIYTELCCGVVDTGSREHYRQIMRSLAERGAGGIVLGCTEIGLLVGEEDSPVPVFDTTALHVRRAVELALDGH